MSNLTLSLVAGYDVTAPSPSKHVTLPRLSLGSFFERLSDAAYDAARRRAERDAARMVAENGGMITDELERRISRHLGA
ncbi:MAG: hypothetical protein AB7O57_21930 [Hyphomicrobiaceae bacterium]